MVIADPTGNHRQHLENPKAQHCDCIRRLAAGLHLMAVVKRNNQLLEKPSRILLAQATILCNGLRDTDPTMLHDCEGNQPCLVWIMPSESNANQMATSLTIQHYQE